MSIFFSFKYCNLQMSMMMNLPLSADEFLEDDGIRVSDVAVQAQLLKQSNDITYNYEVNNTFYLVIQQKIFILF